MSESASSLAKVAEGAEYELLGADDGSVYALRCKAENLTAHLQGDDALRFHADYEAIKLQYPAWLPDQTLAQLWDQGGYSWLAAPDEGPP